MLLAVLIGTLGAATRQGPHVNLDKAYLALRDQVLKLDPASIGVARASLPGGVFGVVTEMGLGVGVATVVAIADGTVSLYFSGGGGTIGLGPHEGPRRASAALLKEAPRFIPNAVRTSEFPLPAPNRVRFYFLTFAGVLTAEAADDDLQAGKNPLSPLYQLHQTLLTEIRLVSQRSAH